MNMKRNRQSLPIALCAAASLSAFVAPASADDSLSERIATGVARYIAAQGNAALAQIRSKLADTLRERMTLYAPPTPQAIRPQPSRNDEGAGPSQRIRRPR